MEYSKIQTATAGTSAFRALPPAVRCVWFQACTQVASEETGGRLRGAASWKDPQWRAALGVSGRDASAAIAAGLLRIDDRDLLVVGYDVIGESAALRERAATRKRLADWRSGKRNVEGNADVTPLHRADTGAGNASPGPGPGPEPETSPAPPSPGDTSRSPAPAPARKAPGGGGAKAPMTSLDPQAVVDATRSGELGQVLAVFKVNTDGRRMDEWLRDTDGLSPSQVAVILYGAWSKRKPIREPSGFRQALESWVAMPSPMRASMTESLRAFAAPALMAAG